MKHPLFAKSETYASQRYYVRELHGSRCMRVAFFAKRSTYSASSQGLYYFSEAAYTAEVSTSRILSPPMVCVAIQKTMLAVCVEYP